MRIGIDARFVGPEGTGLGKYTEKLINSLQKIDNNNRYFIYLKTQNWDYLKIQNTNFEKVLADVSWYSLEEQLKMPAIFSKSNLDLLHVPHFNIPILYRKKFIVTIHDLIHHEFPQESSTTRNPFLFKFKRAAYKINIKYAIGQSQKIIVPSNFVKNEIIKRFSTKPGKIHVTYEAAEEEYFYNQKPATLNRQPALLYIGNLYPHKNVYTLLESVKLLKNVSLHIVCPRNVFLERLQKEIKRKNVANKVKIFGYLNTQELKKILIKSDVFITPSLSEGFGIPGLNAMAAGVPVLASGIPTYKEVYKSAALYFDPKDPKDISSVIKNLIKNNNLRNSQIEKGRKTAALYSWDKMAEQTLKIYENIQ